MKPLKQSLYILLAFSTLAAILFIISNYPAITQAAIQETENIQGPILGERTEPGLSPAVRDLPAFVDEPTLNTEINPRHNPLLFEPDQGKRGTWDRINVPLDPLLQGIGTNLGRTPGLDLSFDGTGNPTGCGSCSPPDTNGDVGPNHYIQMVNATKIAIYDKSGTLLTAPFNLGTLWSSGACTSNAGDPIVLYDPLADRWLLSQFASPSHVCMAVSQTADPTGAYHTYTFNVGSFPDYLKFGVWPDAYYMSSNEATYTAYAFDRTNMLTGAAATFQKFTGGTNLYLPSDLDGPTSPPAGAPNLFYTFKDATFHSLPTDRLEIREFHVDWVTPANSTFTLVASLDITPFTYTVCGYFQFECIQQNGTAQKIDAVSEWPMFRFPYRNFGTHQSLVGTFTVGGGLGEEGAAIRWFELRKTGANWTLYQQGTFDPGDGHDRFMGSIAMDGAGNIALGYSVSSSTLNPSIRYATRLSTDPLGAMQSEAVLIAGGGSQTGSDRWGDYSAMSIDPADDCTFWYTNEYYSANSSSQWKTRVGTFALSECLGAATPTPSPTGPTPTPTPSPTGPTPTPTNTPTPTPPVNKQYLPVVLLSCVPNFSDDFSNPASGWPVGTDSNMSLQYLNGEYQMQQFSPNGWVGAVPGYAQSDYTVTVDVRNATNVYGSAGILFGLSDDWTQFYTFEILPDGSYDLWRYSGGNWDILFSGSSTSIALGTATNALKLERNGDMISLYANGDLLTSFSDGTYTGSRRIGLFVFAFDDPNLDARFDNFKVYPANCQSVNGLDNADNLENPSDAVEVWHSESESER